MRLSNLDNIIEEILKDAESEAEKIIEKAKKDSENLKEKTENDVARQVEKIMEKAKVDGEQAKERIISNSKLVARDKLLVAKQDVIDKVLENAKEKLKDIDHDLYLKYVENALKSLDVKEDSEILLTEKEKSLAKETLFGIKVADDTVLSGFSLRNGKILFNNEFSSIIDNLKEDLEQDIAKMLFS